MLPLLWPSQYQCSSSGSSSTVATGVARDLWCECGDLPARFTPACNLPSVLVEGSVALKDAWLCSNFKVLPEYSTEAVHVRPGSLMQGNSHTW
jgi:hypothetical protein